MLLGVNLAMQFRHIGQAIPQRKSHTFQNGVCPFAQSDADVKDGFIIGRFEWSGQA